MSGPEPPSTTLIGITFVDVGGIARVKAVPEELFERAREHGIGASTTFAVFRGSVSIPSRVCYVRAGWRVSRAAAIRSHSAGSESIGTG